MTVRRLLLVLLLAGVAGCTSRSEAPAPVLEGDAGPPPPVSSAPRPKPPRPAPITPVNAEGGKVTVQAGQTLYAIARATGASVRALIDANNLVPPYGLRVGQVLVVPRANQHVVVAGESFTGIARQYGVEVATLARLNHLEPPYVVRPGVVLILPPPAEAIAAVPLAPPPPAPIPPPPAPEAAPPPPVADAAPVPEKPPARPSKPEPAPKPTESSLPPEPESGAKADAETGGPSVATTLAGHKAPTEPLFTWPLRGTVLSTFGAAAGGTHNDGINIAAAKGATVVAADSGTVAYAGSELKGFGNLLLIKHAGGWVSAYAHNDELLVKKGDQVRRGQPIAKVGNSGGVGQTQLHFELRQGTRAIDPLDHLPQLAADSR